MTLAAEAWGLLPEDIRAAVAHVPILVRDKPSPSDMEKHGIPAGVSGCFVEAGDFDDDQEAPAGELVPRAGTIVLYLDNIKPRTAQGVAAILLHEASHAIGLDERHTEACGL